MNYTDNTESTTRIPILSPEYRKSQTKQLKLGGNGILEKISKNYFVISVDLALLKVYHFLSRVLIYYAYRGAESGQREVSSDRTV